MLHAKNREALTFSCFTIYSVKNSFLYFFHRIVKLETQSRIRPIILQRDIKSSHSFAEKNMRNFCTKVPHSVSAKVFFFFFFFVRTIRLKFNLVSSTIDGLSFKQLSPACKTFILFLIVAQQFTV